MDKSTRLSTTCPSALLHLFDAIPFPDRRLRLAFVLSCAFLATFYAVVVRTRGYDKCTPPFGWNASTTTTTTHRDVDRTDADADADVRKWRAQQVKLRSWILTGFSALVMTLGSIPYLVDLVLAKGDVARVQRRDGTSELLSTFFVAYLVCDLTIGSLQYRKQVTVLTGWVHHTAYTMLLLYVTKLGLCHIFAMAAIMELPTFVLALAMLFPKIRNDLVFASLFFTTRIVLHAVLIALYVSPYGRTFGTSVFDSAGSPVASWVPVLALCAAAPLHILWFTSSIRGILKRRRAAKLAAATKSATSIPSRPRLVSMASSYLASPRSTVLTFRPTLAAGRARRQRIARAIESEVHDFFRRPRLVWRRSAGEYDPVDNDVLKGIGSSRSLTQIRLRTGQRTEQAKRLGGQVRRGLVGF